MFKFFKKLFCKHKYARYETHAISDWYRCRRCGQIERRCAKTGKPC